jgi:hypothetical protein
MLALVSSVLMAPAANANGVPFVNGDVLAATGVAQVKNFSPSGTLQDTLDTTTGSTFTTGMCFLSNQDLLVTNFSTNQISQFDSNGNLVNATWASVPTTPESCTVDASDNVYVGGPGTPVIYEFNSSGTLINSFSVTGGSGTGGTDWLDLASDQCTMLYTGEGGEILSYNVCTHTQNADFATGLPGSCFELRIRPNGEVMVACAGEVIRLDAAGNVLQTYPVTGSNTLFAMNLDPDGTTFWTGDIGNGEVSHVDIATGNVLTQFNSSPSSQLAGLVIVGGIVVSQPTITLSPPTASQNVGSPDTTTATITNPGGSVSGQTITFTVTGVNSASGTATTNASGQATFTYTGTNSGTDTVTGSFTNEHNTTVTGTASVTWTGGGSRTPPGIDDTCTAFGATSITTKPGIDTTQPGDTLVAFVSADAPRTGGQSVTVSGLGLTWTRVASENGRPGDAEVWTATEPSVITNGKVTATAGVKGFNISLHVVAFDSSSGVGASGAFAGKGAPTGTITTTAGESWVWGVGFDWAHATARTVGSGQMLQQQRVNKTTLDTYWVQSQAAPTGASGTPVTINDTAPVNDPYDLVVVEILGT